MTTASRPDPELEALSELRADIVRHGADGVPPPPGLLDGILALALNRRASGRPTGAWASESIDGLESLRRTVADLALVLDGLEPSSWDLPAPSARPDWTVADVIAHLIAGDRYVAGMFGADDWAPPLGTENDHVAMTLPLVEQLRSVSGSTLRRIWFDGAQVTLHALERAAHEGGIRQQLEFAGLP